MSTSAARTLPLAVALVLALAGCSQDAEPMAGMDHDAPSATAGQEDDSATDAADHNEADVAFASGMIAHHEGALEMARLAGERAASPEVRALAERISAAQEPEIEAMTGWLEQWGESGSGHEMGGMDHGHVPGMADGGEMEALAAATGADFDRLFLELMTVHHEGAVEMAATERAEGRSPDAIHLAEHIESSQTAEIEEMAGLLATLGG